MQDRGSHGGFGGRSGGRSSGGRNFGGRSSGNRGFGGRSGGSGGFRRNNFNNGPREMHKAICSDCKKECEVPFKPTEGKKVYCRDCFQNHRSF